MSIRLKIKPAPALVWRPLQTTERFMRHNYMYSLNAVTQWCKDGQIPEQSTIDGWVCEIFSTPISCANCSKDDAMCITCFWKQLNSRLRFWQADQELKDAFDAYQIEEDKLYLERVDILTIFLSLGYSKNGDSDDATS